MRHEPSGLIGWFTRLAIEGAEIPIYGDRSQMRDFVFVDDAADALLRAGASDGSTLDFYREHHERYVDRVEERASSPW